MNEIIEAAVGLIIEDHKPLPFGLKESPHRHQIRVPQPAHGVHVPLEHLLARARRLAGIEPLHRHDQLVVEHGLVRRPDGASAEQLGGRSHELLQRVQLRLSCAEHQAPAPLNSLLSLLNLAVVLLSQLRHQVRSRRIHGSRLNNRLVGLRGPFRACAGLAFPGLAQDEDDQQCRNQQYDSEREAQDRASSLGLPPRRRRRRHDDAVLRLRALRQRSRHGAAPIAAGGGGPEERGARGARLIDHLAAELRVPGERQRVEPGQGRRGGDRAGKVVAGDVEGFEQGLVEGRQRAAEPVPVEEEGVEPVEGGDLGRDRAGEGVAAEVEDAEAAEGEEGGGEGAGEGVEAEGEGAEVGEGGKVGEGAGEGVVVEGEDAELVEAGEGGGGEGAAEAGGGEGEADDAALGALHAPPLAEVEALVEGEEEAVVEVGAGLEGEEGDGVGGEEGVEGRVGGGGARGAAGGGGGGGEEGEGGA
ncbi:hypothetical protein EUGRSUZ_H02097 [Eucalyptus grandis]|uniref:Uncharacterized protein n=2 Tax=Eucalyptus grandis TaxID=71139 RepID=A0ACC3JQM7_EUCGR|nr:hypothetical protein EUGRSUZ_H02097 [Eucalyptus grandis]